MSGQRRVLVVDDAAVMRDAMAEILKRAGFDCRTSESGPDALALLAREEFPVVVTDLRMPRMGGIEFLEAVLQHDPNASVVMVSAFATVQTAVDAMKKGAFDYLVKPFEARQLEGIVEKAYERCRILRENERLREELSRRDAFVWVGADPLSQRLREEIRRIAASASTVLVRGESGVGKEVVARAVHAWSPRRTASLVCVNCAALSAGLLESELFGHEKGAFTGADRARQGRFELADGGTLLLDEVSEIDLALQAKLLRVLQERSFERVGSSALRAVDVRIVATSNRPLEEAVAAGRFRQDLFYRLNVIPVRVPPLRERPGDIPALVAHFLGTIRRRGGPVFRSVDPQAMALLERYRWPGNVRELGNVLERLCLLSEEEVLRPEALAFLDAPSPAASGAPSAAAGRRLADIEREAILATLAACNGHRRRTAEALGIAERTLREKLKEWKAGGREKDAAPEEKSAARLM